MWQLWTRAQHETEREQSDELLLTAMARGEEKAFLIVYRRRQASIYRYALHLSGDADVAAETVQETFMALLRDAARLDATTARCWPGCSRSPGIRSYAKCARGTGICHWKMRNI